MGCEPSTPELKRGHVEPATISTISAMSSASPGTPISLSNLSQLALAANNSAQPSVRLPIRMVIAILAIVACILMSSIRYNLSVAIVAMVEDSCTPQQSVCGAMKQPIFEHDVHTSNRTNVTIQLALNQTQTEVFRELFFGSEEVDETDVYSLVLPEKICTGKNGARLNWTDVEQGIALGSYYYGFAPLHILGGRLAERFGAKWITFIGLVGAALFNVFLPLIALHSFAGFVIVRGIVGLFHSAVQPALYNMFLNWFPHSEQTRALACLLFGSAVGLIINLPIVTAVVDLNVSNGWSYLFYGGSALHILWAVPWVWLVSDRPEENRFIANREVMLIRANSNNVLEQNQMNIPWRSIFRSKVVYAIIIAKFAWGFNHAIIIDNGPSYLNNVAGFGMIRTSVHIAIVYSITAAIVLLLGYFYPHIQKCLPLKSLHLRKIFQGIVFLGSAITMFILPSVECDERMILALIIINMVTQGFVIAGEFPMINEFAGNYSGTVYGFTMTFDSIARFLAPFIRGEIVKQENSLANWNATFYVTAIINVVGFVIFTSLATTSLQTWAMRQDSIEFDSKKIPKPEKREMKRALENPNFRLPINTNEDDWRDFKNSVQVP